MIAAFAPVPLFCMMDGPVYVSRRIDYFHEVFRPKQFIPEKAIDASKVVKHVSVYGGECGNGVGDLENRADGKSPSSFGSLSLSAEEKEEAERLYRRIREIEKMHPSPIADSEAVRLCGRSVVAGDGVVVDGGDGVVMAGDGVVMAGDGVVMAGDGVVMAGDGVVVAGDGVVVAGDGVVVDGGDGVVVAGDGVAVDADKGNLSQSVTTSTPTPPLSPTPPLTNPPSTTTPQVHFLVDQCACAECSPVVQSDGSLYCELCHVPILRDTWVEHMRSICHQMKRWNGVHKYINPYMRPSSQAYHLMQSMGWKEGEGLGVEGQGRLEPIATRLKRNRLGIGAHDDT